MAKGKIIELFLNNPDIIDEELIASLADKYKKPLYIVCKYLFGFYEDLVDSDYYKTRAKDYKKYRDALMNEGFTRSEAMCIILKNPNHDLNYVLNNIDNSINKLNK